MVASAYVHYAVVNYKLIAMTKLHIQPLYTKVYTSNELYQHISLIDKPQHVCKCGFKVY